MKRIKKLVKMNKVDWEKEERRRSALENRLKKLTKKRTKIPMTKYFEFRSLKPFFAYDDELVSFFSKRRRRKCLVC